MRLGRAVSLTTSTVDLVAIAVAPVPDGVTMALRAPRTLRTLGGAKKFPKTAEIVDFRMPGGLLTDEGVKMLDDAQAEIKEAIDEAFAD